MPSGCRVGTGPQTQLRMWSKANTGHARRQKLKQGTSFPNLSDGNTLRVGKLSQFTQINGPSPLSLLCALLA